VFKLVLYYLIATLKLVAPKHAIITLANALLVQKCNKSMLAVCNYSMQ